MSFHIGTVENLERMSHDRRGRGLRYASLRQRRPCGPAESVRRDASEPRGGAGLANRPRRVVSGQRRPSSRPEDQRGVVLAGLESLERRAEPREERDSPDAARRFRRDDSRSLPRPELRDLSANVEDAGDELDVRPYQPESLRDA